MNYPLSFEGVKTVAGDPLMLWTPDKLVENAEQLLAPNSRILDVGSGNGFNGTYLAMHGHQVLSLEINPEYIENGRRIIKALGSVASSHTFVEGNMLRLEELAGMGLFDAVIATDSLQSVQKNESYQVVKQIQAITKPAGLNIIVAYIATPPQQQIMSHLAFFEPLELKSLYASSRWAEIHYDHDLKPLTTRFAGKYFCESTATLIAKKPTDIENIRHDLLRKAEYYRQSDSEMFNLLIEQAESLQ